MEEKYPVGIQIGQHKYRCIFDWPGCLVYPSGAWYVIPDMVVDLDNNIIMKRRRSTSDKKRKSKLTKVELKEFKQAPDITKFAESDKTLLAMRTNDGKIQSNSRPRRRRKT